MRAIITRLSLYAKAHAKWSLGLAIAMLALILLGLTLYLHNSRPPERMVPQAEDYTLPDTLRVITLSGASTYFEYKGEEMGYQYELMSLYASSRSLPYTIEIASSLEEIHTALEAGTHHLSITPEAIDSSDSLANQ